MPTTSLMPGRPMPIFQIAIVIIVLGLIAIFVSHKGLLVAAVVDGKPIYRWDLNNVLMSRYGTQTLDGMISEVLVNEQAQKAGIIVTQTELDARTKSLVDSLGGGMNIDQLLQYQGMTRSDFNDQLKLQLTVEKLLGKGVTVTDDEVTAYISTNSANLTVTTEAGMRTEAKNAIMQQKINDKLQPWFTDLKSKANILRFL